jgi:hypothetical protein
MGEPHDVGDEVNRLVSAVQDWARRAFAEQSTDQPAAQPGTGHHAGAEVECLPWCPICQFAHVLRGEHPELGQRVAEAGTALAAAIKALADATIARAQSTDAAPEAPPRPRPRPRVEHIRLDDPDGS